LYQLFVLWTYLASEMKDIGPWVVILRPLVSSLKFKAHFLSSQIDKNQYIIGIQTSFINLFSEKLLFPELGRCAVFIYILQIF